MNMINKNSLKGKYVLYEGRDHKFTGWRLGKVTKIVGNTLTIIDAYKEKHRINTKTHIIHGVLIRRKIRNKRMEDYTEKIEWN